ncbi:MAG: tetratricopeptide repeat protein [Candidatus Coatesbacteria bacterium]|nr:MAG: tetratricopeptide repeat protein [Candidatus Coatesbacteria bacterium]
MTSKFKDWLAANWWPLVLAALTVATRAVYLATVAGDPFFSYLRHIPDAFFFNNWAQGIASGDWLGGDDVFFIGPLYAYFLALIYKLIGPHLTVIRFLHIGLEVGTALFLFGFTRRALGERAAKIAGVIWVLYLPAIFFSSFILPVSLDIFLIAGSFYFLARGAEGRVGNVVAAGALLGLAALDRGNLLIFVAAAVPLFLCYLKRLTWRRLLGYFAPVIFLVGVVTVRNAVVGKDLVLISSQGGLNFYLGNSERATGVYWNLGQIYQGRPEELNRDLATSLAEEQEGRELKPSEVQRRWFLNALTWARDNPGDLARLYWRKFRFLLNDYEVSLNVDFYFMKFISPFHRVQVPWFAFVMPFGVLGMLLTARKSTFVQKAAIIFVAAYGLSVLLFFISARYRLPAIPILIAFAGAGLARWYEAWRRWRWRAAAAMTAAAVVLGAFAVWPLSGVKRDGAFGQSYYRYGKFYFDEGNYEKAISYFHRSTRLSPEMYQAFLMIGISYEEMGQPDTALTAFYHGTLAAPDNATMHFNFAVALARQKMLRESIPSLHRALELEPEYGEAWMQLAEVYIGLGEFRRADGAYRNALAFSPPSAQLFYRFAELQYQLGNAAEAASWAEAAIKQEPGFPGPGLLLGRILYESGEFAAALPYFEREAALQPGNPRVFAFMSALYVETGNLELAHSAYRDYLAAGGGRDEAFERATGFVE